MMKTYASLFTGGGLADMGAIAAGYTPIWGVEYIPEIADVARLNGLHVTTANILDLDPRNFESPDLFHASPPCPNFSVAKQGGKETALDIALAEKVAEFITVLRPPAITIENVRAYIKSKSYRVILKAIEGGGYMYDARVLNSADFGVPQSRRRLFVRAVFGGMVPNLSASVKHVGWYAAIEDIIDTLPEGKFADWQLARLPDFCIGALFTPNKRGDDLVYADENSPALTITSNRNQYNIKAFLLSDHTSGNDGEKVNPLYQESPASTVRAGENGGAAPRAFLVNENRTSGAWAQDSDIINPEIPSPTVSANGHMPRAFLVDGSNAGREITIRDAQETMITLGSSRTVTYRAWLSMGRVVSMTPRALARFQSVPDSYILPERRTLAGRIIGNGVPCLMYKRIAEQFTGHGER